MLPRLGRSNRANKTYKIHPRWYEQPRVAAFDPKHKLALEVNSNTLGLCAPHQPCAVCTKTTTRKSAPAPAATARSGLDRPCWGSRRPQRGFKRAFSMTETTYNESLCCFYPLRGWMNASRCRSVPFGPVTTADGCVTFTGCRKSEHTKDGAEGGKRKVISITTNWARYRHKIDLTSMFQFRLNVLQKKGSAHNFTKNIDRITSLINGAINTSMSCIVIFFKQSATKKKLKKQKYTKKSYILLYKTITWNILSQWILYTRYSTN